MKQASLALLAFLFVGCATASHVPRFDVRGNHYSKSDPPSMQQVFQLKTLLENVPAPTLVGFPVEILGREVWFLQETTVKEGRTKIVATGKESLGVKIYIPESQTGFLLYSPNLQVYSLHIDHRDRISRWDVANLIAIAKTSAKKQEANPLMLGWFDQLKDHHQSHLALEAVSRFPPRIPF